MRCEYFKSFYELFGPGERKDRGLCLHEPLKQTWEEMCFKVVSEDEECVDCPYVEGED